MNHEHPLQTLSFRWLTYPAREVWKWLNWTNPEVDFLVFDLYFPATHDESRPIDLCAFALNTKQGFINVPNPDILHPYENNTLIVNGPLQLSTNQVSLAKLREMLGPNPVFDYLLFIPYLDLSQRVYYTIYVMQRVSTGDVVSLGYMDTNPSPPATA